MSSGLRARELSASERGAIRIVEVSGEDALARVLALAPGKSLSPGGFTPLALRDAQGNLIDEVLLLAETRERVEIHLHGASPLIQRVLFELGVDLQSEPPRGIEARANHRLRAAASEAAARILLDQTEGALRSTLEALLAAPPEKRLAQAAELVQRGRVAQRLLIPPRVVLAGPANAGKSTLFNLLVGRERVVVDSQAGTTRDAVRERVRIGAYAVDLFDTAGERPLPLDGEEPRIERAGQALASGLRRSADLVFYLVAPGQPFPPPDPSTVVLLSQADLDPGATGAPALSALRSPEEARAIVGEELHRALGLPVDPWEPGAGVPFEPHWVEVLEEDDCEGWNSAVETWLAEGRTGTH